MFWSTCTHLKPLAVHRFITTIVELWRRRNLLRTPIFGHISMGKLSSLVPTNVETEKQKFLEAVACGTTYNPVFTYANPSSTRKTRSKYDSMLSDEYLDRARYILDSVIDDYGSEEAYQTKNWGKQIGSNIAKKYVSEYIKMDDALLKNLKTAWSKTAFCTSCCDSTVTFVERENYYRDNRLKSLLDHEIGTHWTRTFNMNRITGKRKKGSKRRTPFPRLGWLLSTEEGLASLNTYMHYEDKRLFGASLLYLTCYLSSKMSFHDLWIELTKYVGNNVDRLWYVCMRAKRGVEHTAEARGFYKDQSTLSGALRLLALRNNIDFTDLHFSKCSIEELPLAKPFVDRLRNSGAGLLPLFLKTKQDYKEYLKQIEKIAIANNVGAVKKGDKNFRCRRIPYIHEPTRVWRAEYGIIDQKVSNKDTEEQREENAFSHRYESMSLSAINRLIEEE